MKIFKHPEHHNQTHITDIYEDHIISCKYIQDPKELRVMEIKMREIVKGISFKDYNQELIFRDAFIQGYLAAFCVSDEEVEIINSITPLGKALSEDE